MRVLMSATRPAVRGMALAVVLTMQGCGGEESDADRAARSAPPAAEEPTPSTPPAETAPADQSGSAAAPAGDAASTPAAAGDASGPEVFKTYCETCHGASGRGDGPAAAALEPKPASFATGEFRLDANGDGQKGEIEDIIAVVRDGAAKYGGSPLMAPWPMLSPEQLQAVAEHVKSLSGG